MKRRCKWNFLAVTHIELTVLRSVKSNQDSPLLRLPPEIRNSIWAYVLGGKVLRPMLARPNYRTFSLVLSQAESKDPTALLRVCRQVYAETALLPLSLAICSFRDIWCARVALKRLKAYQRKQITICRHEVESSFNDRRASSAPYNAVLSPSILPGLKEFRVCIFTESELEAEDVQTMKHQAREYLWDTQFDLSVSVKVEQVGIGWTTYDDS